MTGSLSGPWGLGCSPAISFSSWRSLLLYPPPRLPHLLHGSSRTSGPSRGGLAAGLLLFLILNFLNAFAFTYPYTLPAMRGMGWAVYLLAALALGFCGAISKGPPRETEPALDWPTRAGPRSRLAMADQSAGADCDRARPP